MLDKPSDMSIAHFLREIARGKDGARDLSREQAHELMSLILQQRVDPLSLGGFAIAMRVKGESADELMGFLAAARHHLLPLPAPPANLMPRKIVWLPSYNGGRRLPNLTPLLAQLLARQGIAVLVHGISRDPSRVTTQALFEAMGWPVCHHADDVHQAWSRGFAAFMPIEHLNPPVARLLLLRETLGVRNSGHSLAKLLCPVASHEQGHFRVVNHTHPEYAESLTQLLQLDRADALLLRGTEGEPVADLRRQPAMQCFQQGVLGLRLPLQQGALLNNDHLGDGRRYDTPQTKALICQYLEGQHDVPEPVQRQVNTVLSLLRQS